MDKSIGFYSNPVTESGLLHHADRGSQYVDADYLKALAAIVYPDRFVLSIPVADILARFAQHRGKLDGVVIFLRDQRIT